MIKEDDNRFWNVFCEVLRNMVFVIRERIQKQNDITVKLNSLPLPDIKGTVHEPRDFLFQVFFIGQFSPSP
jgi:hypothetical protein